MERVVVEASTVNLAPLVPYVPTERLVLTLVPEGAFGGGVPSAPIGIQPFGVLVAIGVYLGAFVAVRHARRVALDERKMTSFITWVVGTGFVLGHVLEVVFYRPEALLEDPLVLVRLWDGLSSFGGFIGGIVGVFLWRRSAGEPVLPYADTLASALPLGWVFGRAGCAVAHDHPGLPSEAWYAVQYPGGGRMDLGLYEMLVTIPLAVAFLWLARAHRPRGFFIGTMAVYYAPIRFGFDFLRTRDARYFALTPAQWGAIGLFAVGIAFLARVRRTTTDPSGSMAELATDPSRHAASGPTGSPAARRAARRAARQARGDGGLRDRSGTGA
jgi:phosphatidylglycerol:prolipoprotein diacylglycerol transferase